MSLDTLLSIGRIFLDSETGLKHHRYIKLAPQRPVQVEGKKARGVAVSYFTVPANADGSFDFAQHRVLDDEDAIRRLFYLNFKTSEADSYKKFIFGDVLRLLDEKTRKDSGGNFVMGDEAKNGLYAQNSFVRGELEMSSIEDSTIANFRRSFLAQLPQIKEFLIAHPQSYLHFDFDGKSWWQLETPMRVLNEKLLADIVAKREDDTYVLQKYLYKALAMDSGRIPGLSTRYAHKCRTFASVDEVMSLVYVLDFSTKPIIRKGDVKIIVLPRGDKLFNDADKNRSAQIIEDFFNSKAFGTTDDIEHSEQELAKANSEAPDENFAPFVQDVHPDITQFDFVFSKAGGVSSPDVDMVEVTGLQRSLLSRLSERVRKTRSRMMRERDEIFPNAKKLLPLSITQSFLNILGDTTTAKKKYQSHLFKVMPQIYTGTYLNDPVLLPSLIEKAEFGIRSDKPLYHLLRWDFMFLLAIRNTDENLLEKIKMTPSYRVGLALGNLARHFSGKNSPIKSFEKNYVGLLSRRTSNLRDVKKMAAEIHEKIIMHRDDVYFSPREAQEFTEAVNAIENANARYDKTEFAFGFFESYYSFRTKTEEPKTDAPQDEAQLALAETTA